MAFTDLVVCIHLIYSYSLAPLLWLLLRRLLVIHGPFNALTNNHLLALVAFYTMLVAWRCNRDSMIESVPAGYLLSRRRYFLSHFSGTLQF